MVRVENKVGSGLLALLQTHPDIAEAMGITEPEKLMESLNGQMYNEEGENDEGSIVDTIADVLQRYTARNTLSGDGLELLKRAILLPSERAALNARLRESLSCTSCGKGFADGDLLVYRQSGGSVLCTRCKSPNGIPCAMAKCKGRVSLTRSLLSWLGKMHKCESCTSGAEATIAEGEPTAAQEHDFAQTLRALAQPTPIRTPAAARGQMISAATAPPVDWISQRWTQGGTSVEVEMPVYLGNVTSDAPDGDE